MSSRTKGIGLRGAVTASALGVMAALGIVAADATATASRALPYDVNGDGYADMVVGSPGEDLGTTRDAGMFHVLYGGPTGVTSAGSIGYHQNTSGVPGVVEARDGFGQVTTSGDFNGDGYADVAVSAPKENVGTAVDAGAVWIFHGSARGLRTDTVKTVDTADTALAGREYVLFGHSLVAGDFDGDGRDDIAIGTRSAAAGRVFIRYGGRTGLVMLSQDTPGVPGKETVGDFFGWSVAAGDVNRDGRDDLVVGEPQDYEDTGYGQGAVTVFYGGSGGPTGNGAQRWSKDTPGVPGVGSPSEGEDGDDWDRFGNGVALADFDGDGAADLAVGAPGSEVSVSGVYQPDAGTVTVLYSDGSRIGTGGAVEFNQQTAGIPGTASEDDYFGRILAAGDADGDGRSDLAIHVYGEGYVTVVPGDSSGLAYRDAKAWNQDSPGIPDTTEPDDFWGGALRFFHAKGSGRASLLVGAPGEDGFGGACTVIHSTDRGLVGKGAQYFSQDSAGVPGTAELGDRFGTLAY